MNLLLNINGSIGRSGWWLGQFVNLGLLIVAITILITSSDVDLAETFSMLDMLATHPSILFPFVLMLWINICLTVKRYHDLGIKELSVTVNLEYISPLQVYVLGEVNRPGLVFSTLGAAQNVTELSLIQAIAQAGSYKPKRAELSKVLLLRKRTIRQPNAAIINVSQLLENQAGTNVTVVADSSKFRYDVWLEDGDIVYVPTTALAKRADYIEYVWTRGIYAVVPASFNFNYNAQDAVDWLGPNP